MARFTLQILVGCTEWHAAYKAFSCIVHFLLCMCLCVLAVLCPLMHSRSLCVLHCHTQSQPVALKFFPILSLFTEQDLHSAPFACHCGKTVIFSAVSEVVPPCFFKLGLLTDSVFCLFQVCLCMPVSISFHGSVFGTYCMPAFGGPDAPGSAYSPFSLTLLTCPDGLELGGASCRASV